MKNTNRLGFYILVNVIVSALTMWIVLTIGMKKFPDINAIIPTSIPSISATLTDEISNGNEDVLILPGQLEISLVLGTGDLQTERVLIKHVGDVEIDMSGWKLADEDGNEFTFPILSLFSGAAVSVNTRQGILTVIDLYMGKGNAIWSVGELVKLIDPSGTIHTQYLIP